MIRLATTLVVHSAIVLAATPAYAGATVQLELVTAKGFPITGAHQWMEALAGLGFSGVRIRSARPADQPQIEATGTDAARIYRVMGVLDARNTLRLPGGSFSIRDQRRLSQWLAKIKAGGEEGLTAKPAAFGLSNQQLVDLHGALAARVTLATTDQSAVDVVSAIRQRLDLPIATDPSVVARLEGANPVSEQMQGLSSGTALAAVLRPLGLIHVPRVQTGGEFQLVVTDVRNSAESWPVGWPPEKQDRELVPKLFEFLDVEIREEPVDSAVRAICQRLKLPVLYDHNSMARFQIDPSQTRVSIPAGRSYYKRILDRVLAQARLKAEIRVDEADQPFAWITTIKRAR